MKTCPQCDDLVHIAVMVCPNPECGHIFEAQDKAKLKLHDNVDIMGLDGTDMVLTGWKWREHTSLASGKMMLAVSYYGRLSDPAVTEYFPVLHEGYPGQKALKEVIKIAEQSKIVGINVNNLGSLAAQLSKGAHPLQVTYKKDGKFFRVLKKEWE
jgi:DNA repair protein RadD